MPLTPRRSHLLIALLLANFLIPACAKKDSSVRTNALPSFDQASESLTSAPPTIRYSNANGFGWTEEWQAVEVIQQAITKSQGHHEAQCVIKFRVKRWTVEAGQKVDPPIERTETEARTIPVA
jgi:hypothetical protein